MKSRKKLALIVVIIAVIAAILVLLGLQAGLGIGGGGKGKQEKSTPPPEQVKAKEGAMLVKVSGSHNDLAYSVDGKPMKDADAIIEAASDRKAGAILIWYDQDPSRDKVHELYQELKTKAKKEKIIVYEPEETPE